MTARIRTADPRFHDRGNASFLEAEKSHEICCHRRVAARRERSERGIATQARHQGDVPTRATTLQRARRALIRAASTTRFKRGKNSQRAGRASRRARKRIASRRRRSAAPRAMSSSSLASSSTSRRGKPPSRTRNRSSCQARPRAIRRRTEGESSTVTDSAGRNAWRPAIDRHARAWPAHPRLPSPATNVARKTWMAVTSTAMTAEAEE